jgi:hypothetical protein
LAGAGRFSLEPHAREGMLLRSITMRQVMTALQDGAINQGPQLDDYNDWRCRLRKRTSGRLVRVVVAIHEMNFLYIVSVR